MISQLEVYAIDITNSVKHYYYELKSIITIDRHSETLSTNYNKHHHIPKFRFQLGHQPLFVLSSISAIKRYYDIVSISETLPAYTRELVDTVYSLRVSTIINPISRSQQNLSTNTNQYNLTINQYQHTSTHIRQYDLDQ